MRLLTERSIHQKSASPTIIFSAAQKQFADFGVVEEVVAPARQRQFSGGENIADVGKRQTFFGVLLHHQNRAAVVVAQRR